MVNKHVLTLWLIALALWNVLNVYHKDMWTISDLQIKEMFTGICEKTYGKYNIYLKKSTININNQQCKIVPIKVLRQQITPFTKKKTILMFVKHYKLTINMPPSQANKVHWFGTI